MGSREGHSGAAHWGLRLPVPQADLSASDTPTPSHGADRNRFADGSGHEFVKRTPTEPQLPLGCFSRTETRKNRFPHTMDTKHKHDWGTGTCPVTPLAATLLLRAARHFIHGAPTCGQAPGQGGICQAVGGLRRLPGLTKVSVHALGGPTLCRHSASGSRGSPCPPSQEQGPAVRAPTPLSTRSHRDSASLRVPGLLGSLPALRRPPLGL